jgi:Kef-type K+ transport system membrane component KefB
MIATIGVVLFMFMLGCELDHQRMQQQWRHSLPIALGAILFPFGVGVAASFWLEVGRFC